MNTPTPHTTYKQTVLNRIKKDIATAQNFLAICRSYILQCDHDGDQLHLQEWATMQDETLEHLQLLNWQLKHTK